MKYGHWAVWLIKNVKLVFSVLVIVALSACGGSQTRPAPVTEASSDAAPKVQQSEKVVVADAIEDNRAWIQQLLYEANQASRRGRWVNPAHDNALLYYNKVLELDPANRQALAGLDSVANGLAVEAQRRINANEPAEARGFVNALAKLDPNHPSLKRLRNELSAPAAVVDATENQPAEMAVSASAAAVEQASVAPSEAATNDSAPILPATTNVDGIEGDTVVLSKKALRKKDAKMKLLLAQLAALAKTWDSRMTIYARNDAEGRWIYQQMREAITDYRLRASLEIGSEPRIVFLDKPGQS